MLPAGGKAMRAGWFADPWGQAPLRWWNGVEWTGDTTGPPPYRGDEGTDDGLLAALVPVGGRVAVVDVETTGLYNADRVLEIGIVTLDRSGTVVDRFETLLNPSRDVGPTWIHQITASMIAEAPRFDDVAHHISERLDGAIVCAHNLPFDQRMLRGEFARAGLNIDFGVGLDTLSVTGCKLGVACEEIGVPVTDAHCALADATAAAELLRYYAGTFKELPVAARVDPVAPRAVRLVTRDGSAVVAFDVPFIARAAERVHTSVDVAPYVEMLDAALADLRLTPEERTELASIAESLGLDERTIERAHRDFLEQLIDAAVEDHVVTPEEHDQLCRVAALLDLEVSLVEERTDGLRSETTVFELAEGLGVCFTGEVVTNAGELILRERLHEVCREVGLVPVNSVTRSACHLLVAADPSSRSGKAAKARQHGIPIASVEAFIHAAADGTDVSVSVLSSAGVALVCVDCGDSWLASRRSSHPRCAGCKAKPSAKASASPKPSGTVTVANETVEVLTCQTCGTHWERVRVRGRKPLQCSTCRGS